MAFLKHALNNLKQLQLAWKTYESDNADRFPLERVLKMGKSQS
jgi:hypothetical protein